MRLCVNDSHAPKYTRRLVAKSGSNATESRPQSAVSSTPGTSNEPSSVAVVLSSIR
jgi:hypothetical protein